MSVGRAARTACILAVLIAVVGGCSRTTWPNSPLGQYDKNAGYRFDRLDVQPDDEVFIILAFSEGGMRASALSFGALEELERVAYDKAGQRRSLLSEVDIVSSVSGGSVPAASYAMYRKDMLGTFPDNFLYQDVLADLKGTFLNPVTWLELASPNVSRIDILADLFDERLYKGKTYAQLLEAGTRPFLILNAADMSSGAAFPFTQEQFDALCSDLLPLPVAQAVAASAAFPVAFTALTLKNYSGKPCPTTVPTPRWIEQGLKDKDTNLPRLKRARLAQSMRKLPGADRSPDYIHLLDGGVADNLGLRGPIGLMSSTDRQPSLIALMNLGQIKRIFVVVVNARSDPDRPIDHDGDTPGLSEQIKTVTSVPIDTVINDSRGQLDQLIGAIERAKKTYRDCNNALSRTCGAQLPGPFALADVETFLIEVDFDRIDDPKLRHRMKNMPTTWTLEKSDVDDLRAVACRLMREHPDYRRLLADLDATPFQDCPPLGG